MQLGESYFEVDRWSRSLRSGDEAAVVVRPEDVVLAEHRDELMVPVVGSGKVVELQFVGAIERLRLEVAASATLASAQRPGAPTLSIEASRTAPDVEILPLTVGQQVFVGFKRMHTLPTPISSLRIVGGLARTPQQLAATPIMRELSERMHIEPLLVRRGRRTTRGGARPAGRGAGSRRGFVGASWAARARRAPGARDRRWPSRKSSGC